MHYNLLFYCTLHLFYTTLKTYNFFNTFLLNACDVPDPRGIDLGVWFTSMNKIGNTKKSLCVEGVKCFEKNRLV